jgi:hypothetical protein
LKGAQVERHDADDNHELGDRESKHSHGIPPVDGGCFLDRRIVAKTEGDAIPEYLRRDTPNFGDDRRQGTFDQTSNRAQYWLSRGWQFGHALNFDNLRALAHANITFARGDQFDAQESHGSKPLHRERISQDRAFAFVVRSIAEVQSWPRPPNYAYHPWSRATS